MDARWTLLEACRGMVGSPILHTLPRAPVRRLHHLTARTFALLEYPATLLSLVYLSVKVLWTNRHLGQRAFVSQVLAQIYFTGVQAIGPVAALALGVGLFTIAASLGPLSALVSAEGLGRVVTLIVVRELAPLLSGGVVIARSVTAISAELGVMRVQREIEAIEAMGLSPVRLLVTPRIWGGVLAMSGLAVLFAFVALFGGFALASWRVAVPSSVFFRAVFSAVTPADLLGFVVKLELGGVGIFAIACFHGLSVGRSSTEVPVAVSRAALHALVFLAAVCLGVSTLTLLSHEALGLFGGVW